MTAPHEQPLAQDLTKRHEVAFAEIKAYYNDVTANNLDLVKALKEDATELRKREAAADKLLAEIAAENRALSEPLAQARCDFDECLLVCGSCQASQTSDSRQSNGGCCDAPLYEPLVQIN